MKELNNTGWNLYLYGGYSLAAQWIGIETHAESHRFFVLRTEYRICGCENGWIFRGKKLQVGNHKGSCWNQHRNSTQSLADPWTCVCTIKLEGGQRKMTAKRLKAEKKVQQLPAAGDTKLAYQRDLTPSLAFYWNSRRISAILEVLPRPQD